MFSYPLKYPFTWLIMSIDIVILIVNERTLYKLIPGNKILIVVLSLIVIITSVKSVRTISDLAAQVKWKSCLYAVHYSHDNHFKEFCDLESKLEVNPRYMYNLCAELYLHGMIDKCIDAENKCESLCVSYELMLIKGYANEEKHRASEAVDAYLLAHYMCPNRFRPLYQIAMIYYKNNNQEQALKYANEIMRKKVKIPSKDIDNMQMTVYDKILKSETP